MSIRVLFIGAFFLTACGSQPDLAVEEQAIRDVAANWMSLEQQKDAAGVAQLFAEDGLIVWEQRAPAQGREAIEDHVAKSHLENPSGEGGFEPEGIELGASGDLAVEQGMYRNPADEGRYVTVHKKVGGEWKILTDMSVSTAPNGGAPAWAVESLERWYRAFNGREVEALADLYTMDARVADAQGRAAIIQSFEAGWAETDDACQGAFDGFEIVGTIASGWGRDFCASRSTGEHSSVSRWLSVHEQQADGGWLLIRDRGEVIQ